MFQIKCDSEVYLMLIPVPVTMSDFLNFFPVVASDHSSLTCLIFSIQEAYTLACIFIPQLAGGVLRLFWITWVYIYI